MRGNYPLGALRAVRSAQEVFVERAERFRRMRDLDLQYPQSTGRGCRQVDEVAAFVDRVGEVADPMPLGGVVEAPAHRFGALAGKGVQRLAAPSPCAPCLGHFVEQRARGI